MLFYKLKEGEIYTWKKTIYLYTFVGNKEPKKTMGREETKMAEKDRDSVFIGRKPIMNYVLACMTLFQGGSNEICIKARGRAVSRAIDVAEIVRRRFVTDAKVKDVKIGTEQLISGESGIPSNVSTIEVILAR